MKINLGGWHSHLIDEYEDPEFSYLSLLPFRFILESTFCVMGKRNSGIGCGERRLRKVKSA
jgi:hypothetical protein